MSNDRSHYERHVDDKTVRYDRVSSVLSTLPKPWLTPWRIKLAAEYAAENVDKLAALPHDERVRRIKSHEDTTGRDLGNEVHDWIERYPDAPIDSLSIEARRRARMLVDFLGKHRVEFVHRELQVFSTEYRYAGTVDAIAYVSNLDGDRRLLMLDWKTGKNGDSIDYALQLTAYMHADIARVGDDGDEFEPPKVDGAAVVHVSTSGARLRILNRDRDEFLWRRFRQLASIAETVRSNDVFFFPAAQPAELATFLP